MKDRDSRDFRRPAVNNMFAGLIVLMVGVVLLLNKLDYELYPDWFFSWGTLIIAIGLIIGSRKGFTGVGWFIMIMIGSYKVLEDIDYLAPLHLHRYGLPLGIIVLGCFLMFRAVLAPSKRGNFESGNWGWGRNDGGDSAGAIDIDKDDVKKKNTGVADDYIDSVTIFGNVKKKVFSKQFQGGDVTNFFGGATIDLTQADIQEPVMLDLVQIFGGVKLIIPANWAIKSDVVAIFGGVDDKRSNPTDGYGDQSKILILHGACIFGGIDIKSY